MARTTQTCMMTIAHPVGSEKIFAGAVARRMATGMQPHPSMRLGNGLPVQVRDLPSATWHHLHRTYGSVEDMSGLHRVDASHS
ncbi:hypothetical protein GCM10010094_05340 [Streptomyces flaveus]|uniref:Uncharacterized protein n=1 Tax=Streptomyces flaveus TaxID=66370 RepID=A0A917QGN6_9ACTN|nr:hypothetical protein GCM10010094_05340 [Streptomyces flaveus]